MPSGRARSAERSQALSLARSLPAFVLLLAVALLPQSARSAEAGESVAVVITQSVGVGPLADRIGNLIADRVAKGVHPVVPPGEASRRLRQEHGTDPLTCGSDERCLQAVGRELGAAWVVAVGIGHFGGMIALELQAVEVEGEGPPAVLSSTWQAPGPDWESTVETSLERLLPAEILEPAGTLFVEASEVGAEVRVGGAVVGHTPLARPVRLPPGEHRVELVLAGYASQRRTVRVDAERSTELQVVLMPMGDGPSLRPWGYAAAGTAVATLVGAVLLHLASDRAEEEARDLRWRLDPLDDPSEALAMQRSARKRRVASHWLYGASATLATTAVGLFLLDPARRGSASEVGAPPAAAATP